MKKLLICAAALLLAALWGLRVYALNHDPVVEFSRRKTVEYAAGETVDLVASDYPSGYADLTGYHMRLTGARLVRTVDLLEDNGYDTTFFDTVDYGEDYALVLLVDAIFWFDGEGDPASNPVNLTNLRLVGNNWSYWYSTEINNLGFLNPALKKGSNAFAITSGRELELTLPFIVREEAGGLFDKSIGGISTKDILKSPPRILAAEYPTQVYVELPEIVE